MSDNQSTSRKGSKQISESQSQSGGNRIIVWIAIIAGGILIAALVFLALSGRNDSTSTLEPGELIADKIGQPVDRRLMGAADAPVLIAVYEDYQCPHCQRFNADLENTIRNDLVASGLAQFEFRNRFVINDKSIIAGMAAECAADQNQFWEYHDLLFAELVRNPGFVSENNLKNLAADLSVDESQFNRCVDTREHYEAMLREDGEASRDGVTSTPTVFINGQKYEGEYAPEALKAAVEVAASSS